MDNKPAKVRWRPRFTLIGLMVLVALCAIATQGYLAWQRHTAEYELRRARAIFDEGAELLLAGESILRTYCRSSERLCEAECRMPFSDRRAATRAHLERIIVAQRRTEALANVICGGDMSGEVRLVEACRQRAEQLATTLDPRSAATLTALERPLDVDFVETPLLEALGRIERTQGIKLMGAAQVIQSRAAENDSTPPLTLSLTSKTTRQVLRVIEGHYGLVFIVDGDVVKVADYLDLKISIP